MSERRDKNRIRVRSPARSGKTPRERELEQLLESVVDELDRLIRESHSITHHSSAVTKRQIELRDHVNARLKDEPEDQGGNRGAG